MLVTNRHIMQPSFESALEAALHGGARWIQLREKDLAIRDLMDLALQAQQLCARYGAMLSINSRIEVARAARAAGVHLPGTGITASHARTALKPSALIGQSVHSVQAAQRATVEGADYLVFGSVFPTASHPGNAPQGLDALREITAATKLPVFAIGGIDVPRIGPCLKAGAYGVAVLSGAWQATNVRHYVSALAGADEGAASV
jgi:thiamine-phosphate pyrophosphorylase